MAYLISETGQELLQDVKRFCAIEIYGKNKAWDQAGAMPDSVRELLCEMGYQTLTIPEELGGLGLSGIDVAAILEEIAKADAGMAVMLAGSNLALRVTLAGGTDAQKEQASTLLAEGGLGAFCLTESEAGSDVSSIKTRAVPLNDGSYKLRGSKQFITNGTTAAFYVVAAKIDGNDHPSLFFVPAGTENLHPGIPEEKLGIRSCDTSSVEFNDCVVPAEALIGSPEANGMNGILAALNEGRAYMAAMAVGVAQRALDEAVRYGKERKQFDRAITDNQVIRFKLADMQTQIEAARQLTAYALQKMDGGKDFSTEAAMAKAFAADTAIKVTGQAMDLFGGYGYMQEFPVEQLLRDARVFQIIEGTGEMQRMLISDRLLKAERG